MKKFLLRSNGKIHIYPEDYAGTYIDYDTLHVLIKEGYSNEMYSNLLDAYHCVSYDYVQFSYNELFNEIVQIVENEMHDLKIVSYGVDIIANKAFVEVISSDYLEVEHIMVQQLF